MPAISPDYMKRMEDLQPEVMEEANRIASKYFSNYKMGSGCAPGAWIVVHDLPGFKTLEFRVDPDLKKAFTIIELQRKRDLTQDPEEISNLADIYDKISKCLNELDDYAKKIYQERLAPYEDIKYPESQFPDRTNEKYYVEWEEELPY